MKIPFFANKRNNTGVLCDYNSINNRSIPCRKNEKNGEDYKAVLIA